MKLYRADAFFTDANELIIREAATGNAVVTVKSEPTKETEAIAKKILDALNQEYYVKTAKLVELQKDYDMGFYTPQELETKKQQILAS